MSWHRLDSILSCWLCALPVMLVVMALSAPQIDALPPTVDEFYSMQNAGWLRDGPYSPLEILESLRRYSPNHAPLYFLLLGAWGSLTAPDIATARVLSLLFFMLALAVIYRLARDFVAAPAGLFALLIAGSSAYVNFHIAFARMYTLLLLLAGIVLWLYLRMICTRRRPKTGDYLALAASVCALANTFLFSATFFLMLGLAHLTLPKDQRWRRIAIAVCAGLLLFSPWLLIVIPDGFNRFQMVKTEYLDGIGALHAWLMVYSNGSLWLPLIALAGIALGLRRKTLTMQPALLMWLAFALVLLALAQILPFAAAQTMRYHLAGWLPFIMLLSAGLYALYRVHGALAMLSLLWIAAGLAFPSGEHWQPYIRGRAGQFNREPMHRIARDASRSDLPPLILTFKSDHFIFEYPANIAYSQREHYYERPGIHLESSESLAEFDETVRYQAIARPAIWLVYQAAALATGDESALDQTLRDLHYSLCHSDTLAGTTRIQRYQWTSLDCQTPTQQLEAENDLIHYQFYGASLTATGDAIIFNDRWLARDPAALDGYTMSWKLIRGEWDNVAQLELPLVNQGALRQFSLDITHAPRGEYQLMLLMYNKQSSDKLAWADVPGAMPAFLPLAEIELK